MIRFFIYTFLITIALFGVMVGLAHLFERTVREKYGQDFNDFRIEKAISPLETFDNKKDIYWSDFTSTRWLWILTNEEIGTETNFYNDSIFDRPYHYSKTIFMAPICCFGRTSMVEKWTPF